MPTSFKNIGLPAAISMALLLSACVYTSADYKGQPISNVSQKTKNAGDIIISETKITGHHYRVVGDIEAYGRSVNLLSSNPTREDVNEALRAEATKQGADGVIHVKYQIEGAGLASRAIMKAHGQAVVFTD